MHAAAKAIIGLVLVILGLAMFGDELGYHTFPGTVSWVTNFIIALTGVIPIFLILVGLFVVWLEVEEMGSKH